MTLITVPFRLVTADHILKQVEKFPEQVQAIEVWINDWKMTLLNVESVRAGVEQLRKAWKGKILIVCKNKLENGNWKGTAQEKSELLLAAAEAGADYVDIGLHHNAADIADLKERLPDSCQLVLSHHDFKKTPEMSDLKVIVETMKKNSADIVKIATRVLSLEDNERLLELGNELQQDELPHVIIGMGERGLITRTLGYKLGNVFDFVSFRSSTAQGQLSLEGAIQNQKLFCS